jgi:hypothetical protein
VKEKTIEQKLVKTVKEAGGIAPKFFSPGFDGMPDRIVLLPNGCMGFVEVKAPGKVPRPLQDARHRMLRMLGYKVYVLDCPEQIKPILAEIRRDTNEVHTP